MLRVTVSILGTMPRKEFRSERGESDRDKSALGFAEDRYSICPMTCLGHWALKPYRPRDCAEVSVKVGVQRSSQRGIHYDRFIYTRARERVPGVVDCT
jgi:hypothetical protein